MGLAITPEHRSLASVVAEFVRREGTVGTARRTLTEVPNADDDLLWKAITDLGWAGLHLPPDVGGSGFGLAESAIVIEGLAAGICPGRLLASIVASATINEAGDATLRDRWLPGLANGSQVASFALTGTVHRGPDGLADSIDVLAVGASGSRLHVVCAGDDVLVIHASHVVESPASALDHGARIGKLRLERTDIAEQTVLPGAARFCTAVARLVVSCEAAGGAAKTLEIALKHAKEREQFGRIIGGFQVIKHQLADMRINAELALSAAWGAVQLAGRGPEGHLAAAAGVTVAVEAYETNARKMHQILGAMGFTWEHDAHLFLRRATVWVVLLNGAAAQLDVRAASRDGVVPKWPLQLPDDADRFRSDVEAFVAEYRAAPEDSRRSMLITSGFLVPHWPKPWGRAAGPTEQLVIEEVLAELAISDLDINGWVLLTLVQSARPEQLERWIVPGLLRDAPWCQMFSESEAGSDAAGVRTRATRTDGGWLVTGLKMWTTSAHECRWGLATVRTDPDAGKHAGITTMAIDLTAPGVTVRPIIEMTGLSTINEVFLDGVFVPDDDVVGEVGRGWDVARKTLANERVSIGGRRALGYSAADLVPMLTHYAPDDPYLARDVGRLIAREYAMQLINVRRIANLVGEQDTADLGPVTKVVSSEHLQHVTELAVRITGVLDVEPRVVHEYLFNRCLTIAGGSSEIGRNVIGERLLGLPRETIGSSASPARERS